MAEKVNEKSGTTGAPDKSKFDYSHVDSVARIAIYDDFLSAPRIIEIQPNTTAEYIEELASSVYSQSQQKGGKIPYTAIREVTENFIHAQFAEIIISILDNGNTIRFSDQGPGIQNKEKAQLPGYSSAIEPMKHYIRGVGSGLPIVKEYLNFSQGSITIEDNLTAGSVVTLSIGTPSQIPDINNEDAEDQGLIYINLKEREKEFIRLIAKHGELGVTDLCNLTGVAQSSTHSTLKKLEEKKLIVQTADKKRKLTKNGTKIVTNL